MDFFSFLTFIPIFLCSKFPYLVSWYFLDYSHFNNTICLYTPTKCMRLYIHREQTTYCTLYHLAFYCPIKPILEVWLFPKYKSFLIICCNLSVFNLIFIFYVSLFSISNSGRRRIFFLII